MTTREEDIENITALVGLGVLTVEGLSDEQYVLWRESEDQ